MGVLPLTLMGLFGLLAYHNVRSLAYRTIPLVRRELDKQITKMVLVQVIYNIIVTSPYVIATIAGFIFPMNDQIPFVKTIFITLQNFYFAVSSKKIYL